MNKIRVIDLLIKMANGEEVPKKIKYEGDIWKLNTLENTYDNGKCCLFEDYIDKKYVITDVLNEEIEIIEEPKNIEVCGTFFTKSEYDKLAVEEQKKIEKLKKQNGYSAENYIEEMFDKINEIIDYINKEE